MTNFILFNGSQPFFPVAIQRNAYDLQSFAGILLIQFYQPRMRDPARAAITCPEIDQYQLFIF